jgi:hypothetical protein
MSEVTERFKAYYWTNWYEEWSKRSHEIHLFNLEDEMYAKFKIKLKREPQITEGVTGFSMYGELKIYTT